MKISLLRNWEIIYWADLTYIPEIEWVKAVEQVEAKEAVLDEEKNIIEEAVEFVQWVEWVQYVPSRWNPDCVFVDDVDINIETQYVSVSEKKWKYKFIVKNKIEEIIIADKNQILSTIKDRLAEIQALKFLWIDTSDIETDLNSMKEKYLSLNN